MAIRQGGGSSASGNVRLKALRHAMGWVSQQQLADAFEKKALECGLRLAVSVRQVRRWESADPPWPTPDYQKVLQELFGRSLTELGFTPPWQADLDAVPPSSVPPSVPPQQRGYGGTPPNGAVSGAADVPRPPASPRTGRYRVTPPSGGAGNGREQQPHNGVLRRAAPPPGTAPAAPGLMPEPAHHVEPRADLLGPPSAHRPSALILPHQTGGTGPRSGGDRPRSPGLLRGIDQDDRIGNLPDFAALVPTPGRTGRLGSPVADQYVRLTASYRQMYWVAPALMTYEPVVNHVLLGDKLLRSPGPARPRRVLAASVSETAMLAGRIAFFDLGDEAFARRCYQLADQAAYEAQEPLLRQAVFAHQAFMPAFSGRAQEARALIARANHAATLADAGAPALMRSWLCAVNAEIESLVGDKDVALRLMDRAEDLLCHPDENEVPAWLDFFDSARLWGFRGGAELAAKRYDAAREALTDALGDLPATAAKQQAVTCADLARVAAAGGDIDEASGMLSRALDALTKQWYSTAMDRVWTVRRSLEPFKNAHCIRRLDEELAAWERIEAEKREEPPALS